ncbi:MAG: HAD family hydrolase [Draconibacterium sp.]|nr:HAD family hydrolase [Draconibacterium sp.]
MKYKCIIFDCDGVLVDSEAISAKVFQEMVFELGCYLDFEIILEQITGTSMKKNLKFFAENIDGNLPLDFEEEFRKRSFEAYKNELKPIDGIHTLMDKITVPICTASSGPQKKIRLNLTTTNLIDKFENNIFSSFDIDSWKPEPKIYLHAAKQMGFEPKDCVVIEDSEPGVIAAVKGGFDVYVLTNKKKKVAFENLGAKVFFAMEELNSLLGIDL